MFFNSKSNALTSIRKQYHLTDAQYNLFVNFLELPEKSKKIIFDLLESSFSGRVSSILKKTLKILFQNQKKNSLKNTLLKM